MELKINMCYSLLLKLMYDPQFIKSNNGLSFTKPRYDIAGMAGYVETDVTIQVSDINGFAEAYSRIRMSTGTLDDEIYKLVFTKL